MHNLGQLDHRYIWHPFTQMQDWLKREPIVIQSGKGAVLEDIHGRCFLDANASIWTNLHGHNHPAINAAIRRQLAKIAHSSALGLANEPAALLAEKLVLAAQPQCSLQGTKTGGESLSPPTQSASTTSPEIGRLQKVFFSDDGSTAMEVAIKLAYEFTRRSGRRGAPKFLSLAGAYHGDSLGAVSLGHIDLFHKSYARLLFKTDRVMAPYCYRCPFNRAKPARADARDYRHCHWECVDLVAQAFAAQRRRGNPYAALVVEPLIQGAAGMIPQPRGWLPRVARIAREDGALLIADEVMTGFGRTGLDCSDTFRPSAAPAASFPGSSIRSRSCLFACQIEGVQPDLLAVAKGLTGGYLPMAATLTSRAVFDAFLGEYRDFKTFFHGHSFTANQLGAAAALANLELLASRSSRRARSELGQRLHDELQTLWSLPNVGDVRQVGLVAGIELVRDWRTRQPFDLRERAGIRVTEAMVRRGVLTRPIGNVLVLMPPYCTTGRQLQRIVDALHDAIAEVLP